MQHPKLHALQSRLFPPRQVRAFCFLTLAFLLLGIVTIGFSGCARPQASPKKETLPTTRCQRIVSLSPGITELVYALKLDNRLVGVTRFCDYPASAQQKAKIGGFTDPSMEAVFRLKPDLVLLQLDQTDWEPALSAMGIPSLALDYHHVSGIRQAAQAVGQTCHCQDSAQDLLASFDRVEARLTQIAKLHPHRPKVMVVVGGAMGSTGLDDVYVAGAASIYPQLVSLAGGDPAFEGPPGLAFAQVSREGLMRVNPDVVFELVPTSTPSPKVIHQRHSQWMTLTGLKAVQTNRVYVLADEVMVRPGPRYTEIAETFARYLYPQP